MNNVWSRYMQNQLYLTIANKRNTKNISYYFDIKFLKNNIKACKSIIFQESN
jgi:hypothetical protein